MEKIAIHNPSPGVMYVGAQAIPPGETRHFDAHLVPPHLRPKKPDDAAPPPPVDAVAELLKKPAAAVIAALPDLSIEDLERLGDLERAAKKPRSTLVSAVAEQILTRSASPSPQPSPTRGEGV